MPDRMPEYMSDKIANRFEEYRLPEYMSDRMSEQMSEIA